MTMSETAQWYVVHTYSGYENKVAANIEKVVENRKLHNLILDIRVPTETVVEIKENVKKEYERKIYPGYVLIKMIMNDEAWYVVRNTRGVTGFVGTQSKAIPLTEQEIDLMGVEKKVINVAYEVGDSVKIMEGPLSGFLGTVEELDTSKNRVRVIVSMFGRETPVELELEQVDPINE